MSDNIPGNDIKPSAKVALEIGVMGSARLTEDDERWKQAHKLGQLLAGEGYAVVTGGYGASWQPSAVVRMRRGALSPVIQGGSILMGPAGSQAMRNVIERYQPLIALHGHIHESCGTVKIGKTVCINPGSAYGEGVLHGALFELDIKKGAEAVSTNIRVTSGVL